MIKEPLLNVMKLSRINYFGQYEYRHHKYLQNRNPKLSFCITCMNRFWQIKETLPINLRNNINQCLDIEFVVVDLGTPGLPEWIQDHYQNYLESGYLRYRQFKYVSSWHASIAKNISHHLALGDIVVNLDCDNFTGPHGAKHIIKVFNNSPHDVLFHQWSGQDGDGTYGRISMRKKYFLTLGGYDESFMPMGYQDHDLILRHQSMFGIDKTISYQNWKLKYPNNQKYSHLQKIYSNAIENDKISSTENTNSSVSWIDMNSINQKKSETNIQNGNLVANS